MKRNLILAAFLGLALMSCQKENLPPGGDLTLKDYFWGNLISASAYGLVVDETDLPVKDAEVFLGNKSTFTDEHGVFWIKNAQVRERLANVRVEKKGYFIGSRTFRPINNRNAYVQVKLLKQQLAGVFGSSAGGEIELDSKVSIGFPADGVVTSDGQPYTGDVHVAISYIDPTAPDLDQRMPGNLLGFREGVGEMTLATFGMVAVELTGDQEQELQLAAGLPATLSISIPASLLGNAPDVIPLWHFDESLGIWVEEGEAVLENGRYVGKVAHFSFWNCDVPYSLVHMEGSVFLDSLANPFEGALIRITVLSNSFSGFGYSDAEGAFEGDIPSGEDLLLEILDACGTVVYSANIGPFTADVLLDPIIIDSGSLTFSPVDISGVLVNCDSLPVTDGYVTVTAGQHTAIFPVDPATGMFQGTFQACDSSGFTLVGVDAATLLQSEELSFPGDPVVDAGQVPTCAVELGEYVKVKMDGTDYLFTDYVSLTDSIPGAGFILYGQGTNQADRVAMVTPATGLGSFQALEFGFGFGNYAQDPQNITVIVTEYGAAIGDLVRGTFEGIYTDSFGNSHTVAGEFKAIRE